MIILYATDHSSYLSNGKVFLSSRIYPILKRYADNFGEIVLYSRFKETENPPDDAQNAEFIKNYVRVGSLLQTQLLKDPNLMRAIKECDLIVSRVPSIPAYKAIDYAIKVKKPYFTESMGCAWDAYWNHGFLGKLIAPYMYFKMRRLVRNADYASYVTTEFLQKRYPRTKESLVASNVLIKNIDEDVLKSRLKRIERMPADEITLMTTAAVNVKYKGQQYVIRAIPEINKQGIRVKYYIVGDGDQTFLKEEAKKFNVAEQVIFTGRKPLAEVFGLLDQTDIYIQPSLQEGLPRSVIEAMSRACLVIGANTAGIPELIDQDYVVARKSYTEISRTVVSICKKTTEEKKLIARRNFEESKKYFCEVLDKRRNKYYQHVLEEISSKTYD